MIDKGKISALKDNGRLADVIPSRSEGVVTAPLVVPESLRGNIQINTEVVYAVFDDNTGTILCRLDGKRS